MAMGMAYHVQYTIQETTCGKQATKTDGCPLMTCGFAVSPANSLFLFYSQSYELFNYQYLLTILK